MRLHIFESHPVQYHAPVYREAHRQLIETGEGGLCVTYATDAPVRGHYDPGFGCTVAWDEPLLEGYPSSVLNHERGTPLRGFRSLAGTGVHSILRRSSPDAVLLTGLAYEFDWAAYLSALRLGIPIWMRMETQDFACSRSCLKEAFRWLAYRIAYLPVDRALVIGRLNALHYVRHGIGESRHVLSPYCVVDRFAGLSAGESAAMRSRMREKLGLRADQTVLLFCGKLQEKKNPRILLDALALLSDSERRRWAVVYVGDGELESKLRESAGRMPDAKVIFAGFQNQTQLAPWYLASDVLVLPSRQMGETWGLVVNEALLAGRRVVVSQHAGCHAEFSQLPSVRVFDGTINGLMRAIENLPAAEAAADQRAFMEKYSVRASAEGLVAALRATRPRRMPAPEPAKHGGMVPHRRQHHEHV